MLPSYFDYILVHLRQKARLRPNSAQKFCQFKARTRPELEPEKPGPTYNFEVRILPFLWDPNVLSLTYIKWSHARLCDGVTTHSQPEFSQVFCWLELQL